jgi:UV DNA damage repair endonuclease
MAGEMQDILRRVREAAAKRILFLPHALSQMNSPERMISTEEVRTVLFHGEVIEDYPEDARGHSCLMLGRGEGRRLVQVVCAPKSGYLAVITAYLPSPSEWELDWRTRREK